MSFSTSQARPVEADRTVGAPMSALPKEYFPTEHERIQQAYLEMAHQAKFRPLWISPPPLKDSNQLQREAEKYADGFFDPDDSRSFTIGVPNYPTNRAFVYTIEAARLLCGDNDDNLFAKKLLQMALAELTTLEAGK